jgi:hypothetical protein
MEHDTEPITQCVQHGKKWSLPLHDINDVMHSQKHKTQTSHENVHKPKHFCSQPIHDNELKHFMTTCPLSTLKDIANNFLVNNSIFNYNSPKFMIIYVTLYEIKKNVAKTNFYLDNM